MFMAVSDGEMVSWPKQIVSKLNEWNKNNDTYILSASSRQFTLHNTNQLKLLQRVICIRSLNKFKTTKNVQYCLLHLASEEQTYLLQNNNAYIIQSSISISCIRSKNYFLQSNFYKLLSLKPPQSSINTSYTSEQQCIYHWHFVSDRSQKTAKVTRFYKAT